MGRTPENASSNRRTLAPVKSSLSRRTDDHVAEVARGIAINLSFVVSAEKFRPTWRLVTFIVAMEVLIGLAVVALLDMAR
jgi:hypothetical protein